MTILEEKTMYSEVYGILEMLGEAYINAIPTSLYNFIKSKKFDNNIKYSTNMPLIKQNVSKDTAEFICMLHYNYWIESKEERNNINKILLDNEEKEKALYNTKNIFKKKVNKNEEEIQKGKEEVKEMVIYKENILRKLFDKVINFLRKI